jgi:hypothetical protein
MHGIRLQKKKNDIKHIIEWEDEEEDLQLSLTPNNKRKRPVIEWEEEEEEETLPEKKKYKKTIHWEYIDINMAKPTLSSMFKTLEASNK